MVFCNIKSIDTYIDYDNVTILILIDGFLQYNMNKYLKNMQKVTILILIDGFLQ